MPTTVRSHAKINLGLYIGAPRPDGFHSLVTVYQTIELHDLVTVSARPAPATSITLTSNDRRVPTDNHNTAYKMVTLELESLATPANVTIHIEKRLPIQGGLGAGSANAIAALIGLEAELGLPSTTAPTPPAFSTHGTSSPDFDVLLDIGLRDGNWPGRQLQLAEKVGSDVPLFLVGGAVLGRDRGQNVFPLPDLEPLWTVIALPPVGVSTPQAFRDWDALCATEGLTLEASADKLMELSRT